MRITKRKVIVGTVVALAAIGMGISSLPGQAADETEVTIYNQGLALIREERLVNLVPGVNRLVWTDFPREVDPTSIQIDWGKAGQQVQVWEQNFGPGIGGQFELLSAYLGEEVTLSLEGGTQLRGELLSAEYGQVLLKTGTGLVSINQAKIVAVRYPHKPQELGIAPAFTLITNNLAEQDLTLSVGVSYLTQGLSWQGDYRLEWDQATGKAHMVAWATVENRSNQKYDRARLNLVAGKVNQSREEVRPLLYGKMAVQSEAAALDMGLDASQLADYYQYTVANPTTIEPFQTKQVRLATAEGIGVDQTYLYDPWVNATQVRTTLSFLNVEQEGLGLPLPAGRVRIYTKGDNKSERLVGEDRLEHLAQGEKAELTLGYAFDLQAQRRQVEVQRPSKELRQESYTVELRNGGDQEVTVLVREHLDTTAQWEITQKSHAYQKVDAKTVEFTVTVPAHGARTLAYTVRYLSQA